MVQRFWYVGVFTAIAQFAATTGGSATAADPHHELRRLPLTDVQLVQHEAPTPAGSDEEEPTLEERLAELEEKYSDLNDAHKDLKKSLKGYTKTGHSGSTIKLNGRVHVDNWAYPDSSEGANALETEDPNEDIPDHFEFRRLRFGVKGDLPANMLYKIEMEFAGGNGSEFRDAYIGWKELPFLGQLLLGNQKRTYGLDHLNSSRYNVFLERPFVIEGFNQDARRFGLAAYGVSDDEAWNWRYGVYNQRLIQDEGEYFGTNWQAQVAGRLANTIWYDECSGGRGYAHWAIAGTWADTAPGEDGDGLSGINEAEFRSRPEARTSERFIDTGNIINADDYGLLGLEGVVNVGPWQLVGEYQWVELNRVAGTSEVPGPGGGPAFLPLGESDLSFHGGYVYLSYFLTGEHIPWSRKSGTLGRVIPHENFFLVDTCDGCGGYGLGAWQVAIRYSFADFSDDDINGGIGENITFGMNWHWTPYARMQFNYIYGRVDNADLSLRDNPPQAGPNLVSGDYQVLGARFMVDF